MKRLLAVGLAAVLVVAGVGGAGAFATAAAPPKVVGVCTNTKNGGYLRMLEAKNLVKSQWGKCRKNEAKVSVPTVDHPAIKKPPRGIDKTFKLVIDDQPARSCTWAASTATLTCKTPTS